jgi:hypothetical protein
MPSVRNEPNAVSSASFKTTSRDDNRHQIAITSAASGDVMVGAIAPGGSVAFSLGTIPSADCPCVRKFEGVFDEFTIIAGAGSVTYDYASWREA